MDPIKTNCHSKCDQRLKNTRSKNIEWHSLSTGTRSGDHNQRPPTTATCALIGRQIFFAGYIDYFTQLIID